jgi:hypothetical protein
MEEPLRRKLMALAGVVIQHVGGPGRVVDGRGVSANDAALRLLADFGFMEGVSDGDERLRVQWTEVGPRPMHGKMGTFTVREGSKVVGYGTVH